MFDDLVGITLSLFGILQESMIESMLNFLDHLFL
jgi:hypothetical protein